MTSEIPEQCSYNCFDHLLPDGDGDLCDQCLAWHAYWCEVDDSEMEIDWQEYLDYLEEKE